MMNCRHPQKQLGFSSSILSTLQRRSLRGLYCLKCPQAYQPSCHQIEQTFSWQRDSTKLSQMRCSQSVQKSSKEVWVTRRTYEAEDEQLSIKGSCWQMEMHRYSSMKWRLPRKSCLGVQRITLLSSASNRRVGVWGIKSIPNQYKPKHLGQTNQNTTAVD